MLNILWVFLMQRTPDGSTYLQALVVTTTLILLVRFLICDIRRSTIFEAMTEAEKEAAIFGSVDSGE